LSWIPHHALVAPEGPAPAGWLLFLHGILGSGANWRTVARRLVAARPDWGAVLVDLRMHGRSQGAPPPHTLDAVAADLERLAADLAGRGMAVGGVVGHSFGGKTALAFRARAPRGLVETWVLDATPSANPEALPPRDSAEPEGEPSDAVADVLGMLERLPGQFSSRDEFLAAVTGRGFSRPLADWLAMNLDRGEEGFQFRLDLAAIRALMGDYYAKDLWPAVESTELPGALGFVVGGRSSAVDAGDRARLEELAAADRLGLHVLDAGHWLHMDAPDELLALLTKGLAAPP
jgi:pimeloyl-ACP methyl ester carboxylesterase